MDEPEHPPNPVTHLLVEMNKGNREAINDLMPLVYDELRRIAARYLANERSDHTLQATALVHEAFLRLVDQDDCTYQNQIGRAHV